MNIIPCNICERGCGLSDGKPGACGLYEQREGHVVERFPNRYLVACPISIETMPVLHFYPGGKFLQISTTGCNFDCPGCFSTVIVREMPPTSSALRQLTPEQVVAKALESGCMGIVFLMNDPLASLPSFLSVASLARSKGLRVGCSSNAYFTEFSLGQLITCIDFINIGLKGFSDLDYRACGAQSLNPVLRNLDTLHKSGVHVEIACIFTKDNRDALRAMASHIAGISREIPLQMMRFISLEDVDVSQEPTIREAEEFCAELRETLDYVYLFNSPGTDYLHTYCPSCGNTVYQREFYGPMGAKLKTSPGDFPGNSQCPACHHKLNIIGCPAETTYQEGDFEGGYPFTRALEMVEAMLIAMGVDNKAMVVKAWEEMLMNEGLQRLHVGIQHPRTYIQLLRQLGRLLDITDRAEALSEYLEERLARIETALMPVTHRPRVYYAMGTPLFYLNGGRLENQLVEMAGGISTNRELPAGGRPGRTLSVAHLNAINPDVIIISAFISNTVEDFYAECFRLGVRVKAVQTRRIYTHPAPGWDFGSPRWILGLMYLASVFHPTQCALDITAEANHFYRTFYGIDYVPQQVNRSFGKPSTQWKWAV